MERESKKLEYKEQVTKSFLKTVSAFANYGSGKIIFGITNDMKTKGFENPVQICLNIENMINDNIDPIPNYSLEVKGDSTIVLTVKEGLYKPYLYNNKAYHRNDSATIEVDRIAFTRLILEGSNQSYEELEAKQQELSFLYLEKVLIEKIGIRECSVDTLKTLQLMNLDGQINNAGFLLADVNDFKGIDIVCFGDNINEIVNRFTLEKMSILKQFHKAIEIFRMYYEVEVIEEFDRKKVELVPNAAFREAIANAIVHRLWDVNAHIKISMYKDKIQISSPGGLPQDMSTEDYLNGGLSILRNPIIGSLFFRLNYIEQFGTGVKRINSEYNDSYVKPMYKITDNVIQVILPVKKMDLKLNENETILLDCLSGGKVLSRLQLEQLSGLSKSQVIRTVNSLMEKQIVFSSGAAKSLKYHLR